MTRKSTPRALLLWLLFLPTLAQAAGNRPNIVLMVMDNLGWGEIGVYGGGILRGAATPRLDQLASQGARLLNFNVETQCTPSRSALMTGRHPVLSTTGGTSDARFIKDYCPVVEFGLVGRTMHMADERVALDDLETLTRIYQRFIADWFG